MAGPAAAWGRAWGSCVLLRPEHVNAYAQSTGTTAALSFLDDIAG